MELMEDCYGMKSTIIVSQLPVANWYDMMKYTLLLRTPFWTELCIRHKDLSYKVILYKVIVGGQILFILIAIPNYFQRGCTQLICLDKKIEEIRIPLHAYLINVLLPEEKLMNFGLYQYYK